MPHRVAILVHGRFTDSALGIALDVLQTADALRVRSGRAPLFAVEVHSAKGGRVQGASGVTGVTARALDDVAGASVVLVPGFWVENAGGVDAVLAGREAKALTSAISASHARGALIASACAGAFLLAAAGILDGKPATTTWWLAPHLRAGWPRVEVTADAALVVAGRVMTAGAVFAQADVALEVVSRFGGAPLARQCANLLLLDRHASQTPYMALQHLAAGDPFLRRAETWVRANLAVPFDIPTLARRMGVSPRTLARKFERALGLTPIGFVQRLRLETAVQLLETSDAPLDVVAERVGYDDPHTLTRLMRRELDVSPRQLRQRRAKALGAGR